MECDGLAAPFASMVFASTQAANLGVGAESNVFRRQRN